MLANSRTSCSRRRFANLARGDPTTGYARARKREMARGGHRRQGLCSTSRFCFCASTLSILYLLSLTGSAGSEEQLEQRQLSATASCFDFVMYDSYGDGWDVATYLIQQFSNIESIASGTLADGYQGTDEICLDMGCYTIRVMSGRWPSEITWELGGLTGSAIPQSPTAVPSLVGTPQVDLGARDGAMFSILSALRLEWRLLAVQFSRLEWRIFVVQL